MRCRTILIAAFMSISCAVFAQTVDNTIYITALAKIHEAEDKKLDSIEVRQQRISYATTSLALSNVLMAETEQKLHKGLIVVYDIVDNAEIIYKIVDTSKKIMDVQDLILELSREHPKIAPIAAAYEVVWIKRAVTALVQLLMATKESKFNIMNNSQRLNLLYGTSDVLAETLAETFEIYSFMNAYVAIPDLDEIIVPEFDFDQQIEDMKIQIQQLVAL